MHDRPVTIGDASPVVSQVRSFEEAETRDSRFSIHGRPRITNSLLYHIVIRMKHSLVKVAGPSNIPCPTVIGQ